MIFQFNFWAFQSIDSILQVDNITDIKMRSIKLILYFTSLLLMVYGQLTWTTTTDIQADSKKIITSLSGNATIPIPSATMVFSFAFPSIPRLTYGITAYRAKDGLADQSVAVNKVSLTKSSLTLQVKITGWTNLWLLQIRYYAINPNFPYHLNAFHSIPINYPNNVISNISSKNSVLKSYKNIINYTTLAQSITTTYNQFSLPLTNNKVALFLSAIGYQGVLQARGGTVYPQQLNVLINIQSATSFSINVTSGIQSQVISLKFGMIIFDKDNLQSSGNFILTYQEITFGPSGGSYIFPREFLTNLMIGFKEFSSTQLFSVISFESQFRDINGSFQFYMPSVILNATSMSAYPPFVSISRHLFSVFYLKYMSCLSGFYFQSSSNQCINCSLECIQCINNTGFIACQVCNSSNNFFLNQTTLTCQKCTLANCQFCSNMQQCLTCNESFFLNQTDLQCYLCSLPNCLTCLNLTSCLICNETDGYFLNQTSFLCERCGISFCLDCLNLTACQVCDEPNNYFLNDSSSLCQPCNISGCISCKNLVQCLICNNNNSYFLNGLGQCQLCGLAFCLQCSSLNTCTTCDQASGYFLNPTLFICQACSQPFCLQCSSLTTCAVCDNSTLAVYNNLTGQCSLPFSICGDNIYQVSQQCDDGNLADGDGCSKDCIVETNFKCQANTNPGSRNSVCFYSFDITLRVVYIEKFDYENKIEILLEITPANLSFWDTLNFTKMITLSDMTGFSNFTVVRNPDLTLSIFLNYDTDIHNKEITVQFDPKMSGQLPLSRISTASRSFSVVPHDNELAVHYNDSFYKLAQIIEILAYIISGLALLIFFVSVCCGKLVGVEMMSVLQMSFLALMTLSCLNPCFKSLSRLQYVNGFNYFQLSKDYMLDLNTPHSVKGLRLSSLFFQNYNINTILLVFFYLVSLVCFILSKTFLRQNQIRSAVFLKYSKKLACEVSFNFIMFSGYILGVSFGLQLKYGIKRTVDYLSIISLVEMSILFILYFIYFFLLTFAPNHFGEFSYCFLDVQTLKQSKLKKTIVKKWYNILMVERLLVGSCFVFLLQMQLAIVMPLCIFLCILILTILLKQYISSKHNIRFGMNKLIILAILGIYLSYRLTMISQQSNFIYMVMPFVILILMLACILYSSIILIHELCTGPQKKYQDLLNLTEQEEKDKKADFNIKQNIISAEEIEFHHQKIVSMRKLKEDLKLIKIAEVPNKNINAYSVKTEETIEVI